MDKKPYKKDEGNALKVQKHQLKEADDKVSEIDSLLSSILNEQSDSDRLLDSMVAEMEGLVSDTTAEVSQTVFNETLESIEKDLNSAGSNVTIPIVSKIDHIELDDDSSWSDYLNMIEDYGFKNNLNLKEDPFQHLMTKSQQVELQKRIKDDFTLKNANCDQYDYMIAGTCGVIGGLIDVLFVGMPGDSKLGNITDDVANKTTEKFASLLGWDKEKALNKGSNTTKSAIGFLERKYEINYDQSTTQGAIAKSGTGGAVKNLSKNNHHLKSLGHSPDIVGLFFSILNQFTGTSTFVSNGKIITIDAKKHQLQGGNFIAKIFCGFANWFGHIMSDWTGSSGAGGRGAGVPIPFYNLFQLINFGRFGENDRKTFAMITSEVFEEGYDFRHGMAMAIPVIITELLVRLMYTIKSHFYHDKPWKDSIPRASVPEVRRMLLVGHGTLCLIDGADAAIRANGNLVQFLLRTNLIAWSRTGKLALKELSVWYHSGHIDADIVDEYLDNEYKKMLNG